MIVPVLGLTLGLGLYLGAAGLVGGAGVRHLLWPLAHRPFRLRWLGAGYALLVTALSLKVWQTLADLGATAPGDLLRYLLDVSAGRAALWTLLGATLLMASEVSGLSRLSTLGAAGLTLWGLAGTGHGATHGDWVRALHGLHAGAMSLWLAGVLSLWLRPGAEAARRFSPWALGCLLTLGLTGAAMTLSHAGLSYADHVTLLAQSEYGRTLLIKVGVYLLLPGAALLARRALFQAAQERKSVRLALGAEAALLLGVLALTAHLTGLQPPAHAGHGALTSPGAKGAGKPYSSPTPVESTAMRLLKAVLIAHQFPNASPLKDPDRS